jgi:hypothetical protein
MHTVVEHLFVDDAKLVKELPNETEHSDDNNNDDNNDNNDDNDDDDNKNEDEDDTTDDDNEEEQKEDDEHDKREARVSLSNSNKRRRIIGRMTSQRRKTAKHARKRDESILAALLPHMRLQGRRQLPVFMSKYVLVCLKSAMSLW